jgi:hypothetical protein
MVYGGSLTYAVDKDFLEFFAELHETLPVEANIEPQLAPGAGENGETLAIVGVTWCGQVIVSAHGRRYSDSCSRRDRFHTSRRRV